MTRRLGMVGMVLLALVVVGGGRAEAINKCKRQCAVFMRKDCRRAVHGGVKAWQDMCKSLFDSKTHRCKPDTDCLGYANLSKCRTAGTKYGSQEGRSKCGKDARKTCQTCCDTGTLETCVHSPSGAFLEF